MNIKTTNPQAIADAKAKAKATAAYNRANGIPSVHQRRKMAKGNGGTGNGNPRPYAPPPPRPTYAPPPPPPRQAYAPPPPPTAPIRPSWGTGNGNAAPSITALKLEALVKLEAVVKLQFANPANRTDEATKSWDIYQKCKALALNNSVDAEAKSALRRATIEIVKIVF